MDVEFVAGESYRIDVRGHRILVDHPADAGGAGTRRPSCSSQRWPPAGPFYAGRYLTRHGYGR